MKQYIRWKREELIWALGQQDYSLADIGAIFNISKTTVHKIINRMPKGWTTPWKKDRA